MNRPLRVVAFAFLAAIAAVRSHSGEAMVEVLPIPDSSLRAGDTATVAVLVTIAQGFHVQANPAANAFLIPLELRVRGTGDVQVGEPVYPPPVLHRLEGSDLDLTTYEKAVEIALPLSIAEGVPAGEWTLEGDLRFQACDARRCFPPATVPVSLRVRVHG